MPSIRCRPVLGSGEPFSRIWRSPRGRGLSPLSKADLTVTGTRKESVVPIEDRRLFVRCAARLEDDVKGFGRTGVPETEIAVINQEKAARSDAARYVADGPFEI